MIRMIKLITVLILLNSCGDKVILDELIDSTYNLDPDAIKSGDVVIISGGTVSTSTSPYPLHEIHILDKDTGDKKKHLLTSTGFLSAGAFLEDGSLIYSIDNPDRIDRITMKGAKSIYRSDSNIAGSTIRAMGLLDDGSVIVAETANSIEKFDPEGNRVITGFPFTSPATNIENIRGISGNRFVVLAISNTDTPRVYNASGTLVATISGFPCGNDCDPNDIVELPSGEFVLSLARNVANGRRLVLLNSSFAYQGTLFNDITILPNPGALDVMEDGSLIACDRTLDACMLFSIDTGAVTATHLKTFAFLREPKNVRVVP